MKEESILSVSSYNNYMENKLKGIEQKSVIAVVISTAFITTFTGSALNLSVPDIGKEFNVDAGFIGWLITGYTLAVAAFSVPIGKVADMTCKKTVLIIGLIIFVACCITAIFSISAEMLIIIRILQGIGAAMIFSTNTAVLISSYDEKVRGRMLGYSLAATYTGLSAGPVVGGILNHNFGWESIFILTALVSALALVAAFKLPRQRAELHIDKREKLYSNKFDICGSLLYVIFIVLFMYGLSVLNDGLAGIIITSLGIIAGSLFVIREMKVENPVMDIRQFIKQKGYVLSNVAALMNYSATFAISYLISIYLQVVKGQSSQLAGMIMIFQPIVMAMLSPAFGKASDKVSPFKLSSIGMAFCAAGATIFIFIGEATGIAVIIVALIVTGLGFAMFSSPNTNAVLSFVGENYYSVASSILATMRSIGHTLSMAIVTIIVNMYMPEQSLDEAEPGVLVDVINVSFTAFAVICAAGIVISLKR